MLTVLTCLLFAPALATDSVFYYRDISQNHHPYRQLTLSIIGDGEAPLWNPYRGSGQPLLANPNALVLHPTTLLFFILPFEAAMKASVILQILLAAVGAWLLMREIGVSRKGSLLGAAVFAFSGYMVSLGNLLNLLNSAAFMPLTLWLLLKAVTRRFAPWGSLAALSLAVQVLAGEPGILICTAAAFTALHWSAPEGRDGSRVKTLGARVATIVGVGLLALVLAMAGVLPTVELLSRSERAQGFGVEETLKWSQPPLAFLEILVPHLFGDPSRSDIARYWGGGTFDTSLPLILSVHLGPAALLLAGLGLFLAVKGDGRRRAEGVAHGCLALVGAMLAAGRFLPLYPALLGLAPPLESVRYPVKYLLVTVWSLSILAARGYDGALGRISAGAHRRRGRSIALATLLIVGGLAIAATGGLGLAGWMARGGLGLPQSLLSPDTSASIRSGLDRAIAEMVVVALLMGLMLVSGRFAGTRWLLLALPIVCLLHTGSTLNPTGPARFYESTPWIESMLGPAPDQGRIWAAQRPRSFAYRPPENLDPTSLIGGFFWDRMTLRNATGLARRLRFAFDRGNERLDVMPGAAVGKMIYGGAVAPEEQRRLLSAAGVTRLIVYGGPTDPDLVEMGRLSDRSNVPVVVLSNSAAMPRVYVVATAEVHSDPAEALERLRAPDFDLRRSVILEDPAPALPPGKTGAEPAAEVISETTTRVLVRLATPEPGYLVLTDTYYPGWKATVDGVATPILRANAMFRAVPVAAGPHEVEFVYSPSTVRNGLMVTGAGLLLAALLAVPRRGGPA